MSIANFWEKIVEKDGSNNQEELTEAYATEDCCRWTFPACFQDFRVQFAWVAGDVKPTEQDDGISLIRSVPRF